MTTLLLHKPGTIKAQCCQCRKLYTLSESEVERLDAGRIQAVSCPACTREITERFRSFNQRRKAR